MSGSYCRRCDDYGHSAEDHQPKLSKSVVRRLRVVKGSDRWWIDEEAFPNGIGPICLFCKRLIDWAETDHSEACPVRNHINMNEEEPDWLA